MTKTIILTDLVINEIRINYDSQTVTVLYSMIDAGGKEWEKKEATFWVTMPVLGEGEVPNPNWFQLPAGYIPTLVNLKNDADAALTAAFLV